MITISQKQEKSVLNYAEAKRRLEQAEQAYEAAKRDVKRMGDELGKLQFEANTKRSEMVSCFTSGDVPDQVVGADCPSILKIQNQYFFMAKYGQDEVLEIEEVKEKNF